MKKDSYGMTVRSLVEINSQISQLRIKKLTRNFQEDIYTLEWNTTKTRCMNLLKRYGCKTKRTNQIFFLPTTVML